MMRSNTVLQDPNISTQSGRYKFAHVHKKLSWMKYWHIWLMSMKFRVIKRIEVVLSFPLGKKTAVSVQQGAY